jgi:thiol-disulfide isomerase/thioredoxin
MGVGRLNAKSKRKSITVVRDSRTGGMNLMSLRWDLLLFSATAAAFVGHQRYSNRSPRRRQRSLKQVSFKLDNVASNKEKYNSSRTEVHSSIREMVPSIDFGVSSPKIVGLLFAASWCPDCTDVIPAIGKVMDTAEEAGNPIGLSIIYVSSDNDEDSILQFKPKSLLHIPYDAVEERSELKRKYQTCASKETSILDMKETRKHGIPTLILLEASTGSVFTEHGVDDVMNNPTRPFQVLELWKENYLEKADDE